MEILPRPYQLEAARATLISLAKGKQPLIALPTGCGKTVIVSMVICELIRAGFRPVFVCHLQPLVTQTLKTFAAFGIERVGIIWGDRTSQDLGDAQVVIAMAQSLESQGFRDYAPTHVFFDEADRSAFREIFRGCPLPTIPVTATPYREDGRFDLTKYEYIQPLSLAQAINQKYLCDFDLYSLDAQLDSDAEADDMVSLPWLMREWGRVHPTKDYTLFYAPSVGEAHRAAKFWSANGYPALVVSDSTPSRPIGWDGVPEADGVVPAYREDAYKLFRLGHCKVLFSRDVLTAGFDEPLAACEIIVRRPPLALWVQMIGRVLRPHPNKHRAIVLDVLGAAVDLGSPKDITDWRYVRPKIGKVCQGCRLLLSVRDTVCPSCGTPVPKGAGNGGNRGARRDILTERDVQLDYRRLRRI